MPADEYAAAGTGGALRLKGAKVEKHKSKKHHKKRHHKKDKRDKALEEQLEREAASREKSKDKEEKRSDHGEDEDDDNEDPYARMTPAERRFAEAQDKKIRDLLHASPEEARAARPELFKSHKERLADLNAYLSRMSEHHDMPKIGPG